MNILHLRYAIEVERTRSISKAAENLFMNQSNLSRAIRELEQSLGVTLFKRTSKGMTPTPGGEEFLCHAKRIIAEIDRVEALYKRDGDGKIRFAVSVPRADYVSAAFAEFAAELPSGACEVFYKETNALETVSDLLQADFRLGIIRYQTVFDSHFKAMLHEKDLHWEPIAEHSCRLLLSAADPLASREQISPADLADHTEIAEPDPYVPSLPLIDALRAEHSEFTDRRICVYQRVSRAELLSKVPGTFLWADGLSDDELKQYGLVQKNCTVGGKTYCDLLIYRKGYHFTPLERRFIELVEKYADRLHPADSETPNE
ncbi:MAG: LysR family transcriptional regulator [Clostridia bacterium]|nr:LysR family transcriptional regulator [Clostridia bacterium]